MKKEVKEALDQIAESDEHGRLHPEDIVEHAKARGSVLHDYFTWDDGRAAHQWRINEARDLIRSYAVVVEQVPPITTRAWVSLKPDRLQGGGYTSIGRILSQKEQHAQMLRDALEDFESLRLRYEKLHELQPVFAAVRKVRRRHTKAKETHAAA